MKQITFTQLKRLLKESVCEDSQVDDEEAEDQTRATIPPPKVWHVHVSSTEDGFYDHGGRLIVKAFKSKDSAWEYAVRMMNKYCDRYHSMDMNTLYGTYLDGTKTVCCTVLPAYN